MNVAEWVRHCADALDQGGMAFGHGTDNALDEAAWMVLHVLGLPLDGSFDDGSLEVGAAQAERIESLLRQRLVERKPLAYLLREAWFCGLKFHVNESVLVPRSPIAELIANGFQPWIGSHPLHRVLDLCTGSGCIAIAMAVHLPECAVDAADISEAALEVAARNVHLHGVGSRVRLFRSDLMDELGDATYDLIVSNPPYVAEWEWVELPREYGWEPRMGLVAEHEGLELVVRILRQAPEHLVDGGTLICEVGEAAPRLEALLPKLAVTWLEFEHGGGGVFTIDREALLKAREDLDEILALEQNRTN